MYQVYCIPATYGGTKARQSSHRHGRGPHATLFHSCAVINVEASLDDLSNRICAISKYLLDSSFDILDLYNGSACIHQVCCPKPICTFAGVAGADWKHSGNGWHGHRTDSRRMRVFLCSILPHSVSRPMFGTTAVNRY